MHVTAKILIKNGLSRSRVLPMISAVRDLPRFLAWVWHGCRGVAPGSVKRRVLTAYLQRYGLRRFVETGTYAGDTLAHIAARREVTCASIELDDTLFAAAEQRFHRWPQVTIHHGNSAEVLPRILDGVPEPTLFWLDGHYSGAGTGRGELDTPVVAELNTLLGLPAVGHVILIDDARCFDGRDGYPTLEDLLALVRRQGGYQVEVSADIIRLTPVGLA